MLQRSTSHQHWTKDCPTKDSADTDLLTPSPCRLPAVKTSLSSSQNGWGKTNTQTNKFPASVVCTYWILGVKPTGENRADDFQTTSPPPTLPPPILAQPGRDSWVNSGQLCWWLLGERIWLGKHKGQKIHSLPLPIHGSVALRLRQLGGKRDAPFLRHMGRFSD